MNGQKFGNCKFIIVEKRKYKARKKKKQKHKIPKY